jgi:hypothetical protein
MLFVVPKIRVGSEYMTLKSKSQPYQVNGFLIFLLKMVLGKPSLKESTLARKRYPSDLET